MDLSFQDISGTLRLIDADELIPIIQKILPTWPFTIGSISSSEALITIKFSNGQYSRTSPWLEEPKIYYDPINAVCDFLVDLVHAFNTNKPEDMCLHCAAISIDGKAVVFPNGYNQGKSTLIALLASRGIRVVCDDVLPFTGSEPNGLSLGIQPRLRNPIPETFGKEFNHFANNHIGPASDRFSYLNLSTTQLASFGEQFPIAAIVLIQRGDFEEETLLPASKEEALKNIIERNFANNPSAINILDTLHSIIEEAPCYQLNWSNGKSVGKLLLNTFSSNHKA
ncbi:MAG: hypothetical protein HON65_07120 [Rhodospirillales bacterium]|jgi:hypothetical protein|nr:hypothetical protein [Rhodospirillales bacterium]